MSIRIEKIDLPSIDNVVKVKTIKEKFKEILTSEVTRLENKIEELGGKKLYSFAAAQSTKKDGIMRAIVLIDSLNEQGD